MRTLRLDARDDTVWERTGEAIKASADVPGIKLRCHRGHCHLGFVGDIPGFGPMMTSGWTVEVDNNFTINVNGRRLNRRAARRANDKIMEITQQSGRPDDGTERHGTIALLALPPDLPPDYPDLLVRCEHGDAVLDRHQVIGWVRAGKAPKIKVTGARYDYEPLRAGIGTTTKAKTVRKFRSSLTTILAADEVEYTHGTAVPPAADSSSAGTSGDTPGEPGAPQP